MNGFSLWLAAGAVMGLWQVARGAPPRQASALLNLGLVLLAAALLGARLFYAGLHWPYFAGHPLEILALRGGGLAWPGAFAGVLLLLLPVALHFRGSDAPFAWLADRFLPLLAAVSVTAWMGCWWAGSAYGLPALHGQWWGAPAVDELGLRSLRLPLQPIAALSLLAYYWLIETRSRPAWPAGQAAALGLAGLLVHLLAATFLRGDPSPTWYHLRVDAWMAAGFLTVFLLALAARRLRKRARPSLTPHFD